MTFCDIAFLTIRKTNDRHNNSALTLTYPCLSLDLFVPKIIFRIKPKKNILQLRTAFGVFCFEEIYIR